MEDLDYKLLKSGTMSYLFHVGSTQHGTQQTQIASGVFAGWIGDNQKEIYFGTNSPPLSSPPPNNKQGENSVGVHWSLQNNIVYLNKSTGRAGSAHETQDQREVCWRGCG